MVEFSPLSFLLSIISCSCKPLFLRGLNLLWCTSLNWLPKQWYIHTLLHIHDVWILTDVTSLFIFLKNELQQLKMNAIEAKSKDSLHIWFSYMLVTVIIFAADDIQVDLWTIPNHQEGLDLIQSFDPYKKDAVKLLAGEATS